MEWCNEHENLLQEWAEKARFYAWMHRKTSADYGRLNNLLSIPMIIISMIDGSVNFTMVGNSNQSFLFTVIIPLAVGILSMLTGILSAISKYLKTAELSEKHELFYRQFNVLVRNISIELSVPSDQRKHPSEILNMNRYEFDRLMNEAPRIPERIVTEFNLMFPYKRNKPEIANTFNKIIIHGRNANYKKKLDEFQKIRLFYKWKAYKYMNKHDRIFLNEEQDLTFYQINKYENASTVTSYDFDEGIEDEVDEELDVEVGEDIEVAVDEELDVEVGEEDMNTKKLYNLSDIVLNTSNHDS